MILVVGATGHLGGLITSELLSQGEHVRALVRPTSDPAALVAAGAEIVTGDLADPPSLRAACTGVDAVITTATGSGSQDPAAVEQVDRAGNLELIDAARNRGVARFVLVSALGAHPDHPVPLLAAKGAAEEHLRASGLAWTVLQPDLFMDKLPLAVVGGPALRDDEVVLVDAGTHRHSLVAARDVARYAVRAVVDERAVGTTLLLGGPHAVGMRDVVAAFSRELGRPVAVTTVASGAAVPGMPAFLTAMLSSLETYESVVDSSELAAAYGVRPTSLPEFVGQVVLEAGASRVG